MLHATTHANVAPAGRLRRGARPFAPRASGARSAQQQPSRQQQQRLPAAAAGASGSPADAAASSSGAGASRRQLLAASSLGALLAALPPAPRAGAEALAAPEGFKVLYDPTLAYEFAYPTVTTSGLPLQMTLTHPPEKYSSAAPLTADARQRIVGELFDLNRFVTASMTVGPASGVLKQVPQQEWRPRDVALTVLIDRSTARLSSGQRTALNDVEEVHAEEREDGTYYVYEHLSQGSPTVSSARPETFRHALAVTTTRPGLDGQPYLYTLNLSCPQALWDDMSGPFKVAIDSFRLRTPTNAYVPPDQNPWLFF